MVLFGYHYKPCLACYTFRICNGSYKNRIKYVYGLKKEI